MVRHTITPMIFIEVAGEPVFAPDDEAEIRIAEGCEICQMEIGEALNFPNCPGPTGVI
jgi:hypothetical protein